MQTRRFTRISGITLAGILTLTGVGLLGFGSAAHAAGGGIEGTWLNAVNIVSCTNPDVVFETFESMTTYLRGGTLLEGGAPPGPPPAVSRSAGHGIWERTRGHTFHVFFRFHSFDDLGGRVNIVEVTTNPHLIKGDNPDTPDVLEPYYLRGKGTNRITNLDPENGRVTTVTEGCNDATSRPVLFEE